MSFLNSSFLAVFHNIGILSYLTLLPIISAILLCVVNFSKKSTYYNFSLLSSVTTFALSIYLLFSFDINNKDFQFQQIWKFISYHDIKYFVGIDGISLIMIILTAFLTPICIILSKKSIKDRYKEFIICFLLIEGFVIGSFCALDILFFYIFFEAALIPMFIIIGVWGGEKRVYASYKFFLYTIIGSLFFLIAIICIYLYTGTTDVIALSNIMPKFPLFHQNLLWLAFFASFAIKVPMFPLHTWLPDAHVQAPTSGSVILAGILIKLGAYGFLRFSLPFFPEASKYFADMVLIISVIAIIYASFVALMQEDIKKMIAYSSVAHMGFVTMGIFSFNKQALDGAIIQMISHGIISSALFICVGVIYDRLHSKKITDMGGIAEKMPVFAMLAMIFTMASVGLPGTSGFVGEFLTIIGTFQVNIYIAFIAAISVIFSACYMLWLYKRVWFSEITNQKIANFKQLSKSEFLVLSIMALLVIILGIMPNLLMQYFILPVESLTKIYLK
jgi:NADH-quinone oxidoreductase subunit M